MKVCSGMKLFVKCRSDDKEKIQNILEICGEHGGSGTVAFYFDDVKKYVKPKNCSGVYISEELLGKLNKIVGIDNIALTK